MSTNEARTEAAAACPTWCTQTSGKHEVVTREGRPVHYGPDFDKRVSVARAEGQPFEAFVSVGSYGDGVYVSDPDELRRTARAMVAAATWIEENGADGVETLPEFGLIQIERESGNLVACLGHNSHDQLDDLDARDLRRLAASAHTAAEFLEAGATPVFSGPGAAYRVLREAAGLSLEECARIIDVPADYLHEVEEGNEMPEPAWWTLAGQRITQQL